MNPEMNIESEKIRLEHIVKLSSPSRPDLGAYVTIVGGERSTVRETLMADFNYFVSQHDVSDGERDMEILAIGDAQIDFLQELQGCADDDGFLVRQWVSKIRADGTVCAIDSTYELDASDDEPDDEDRTFRGGVFRIYSPSRPDLYFEIGAFDMADRDVDDVLADRQEIFDEFQDDPDYVGPLWELFDIGDVAIELLDTFECPMSEAGATVAEYTSLHQAHFDDERARAINDAMHQYMTEEEIAIALGEQIQWTAAA